MKKQFAAVVLLVAVFLIVVIVVLTLVDKPEQTSTLTQRSQVLRQDAAVVSRRAPKQQANETPEERKKRLEPLVRAHNLLGEALKILASSHEDIDTPEKVAVLTDLGISFSKLGLDKEADDSFKAAIKTGCNSGAFGGRDSPRLIPVLEHYIKFLDRLERVESAAQMRQRMLRIQENIEVAKIMADRAHPSPLWLLLPGAVLLALVILLFTCSRTARTYYLKQRFSDEVATDAAREILYSLRGQSLDEIEIVYYDCPARANHIAQRAWDTGIYVDSTTFNFEVWREEEYCFSFSSQNNDLIVLLRLFGKEKSFMDDQDDGFWEGWEYSIPAERIRHLAGE